MNRMILIAIVIVAVLFIIYQLRNASGMNQSQLKEKIDSGALVVDVRTVAEFNVGHYPNARNIPIDEVSKRVDEFGDKNQTIIVYCASGGRSGSAKSYLESIGYKQVINAGGLSNMPNP
ncbi:MAG: rhodanese-like domain-containing protein [Leptospira bouyouniensis]|uniref:Rhodanese-like domain-containing protein n=1 Tax=Leptospira bouyouniensis TaxID=2484911 RepID=A0A7I0HVF8_9LEPT|nr:rhodanese-like domain-containing protein [Leptospira bouyouniensis]TGK53185.1 rhodanese-like domain-containing protein [Leptospira bouyouniensis]TGL08178.1 rhodanese-like domain-containing protein [Leptospira bouyouniensis]TGM87403.1 rhodanese-like domain-containing protein [Leptospira bouyouniensis]